MLLITAAIPITSVVLIIYLNSSNCITPQIECMPLNFTIKNLKDQKAKS
jgi:hypothetical protein